MAGQNPNIFPSTGPKSLLRKPSKKEELPCKLNIRLYYLLVHIVITDSHKRLNYKYKRLILVWFTVKERLLQYSSKVSNIFPQMLLPKLFFFIKKFIIFFINKSTSMQPEKVLAAKMSKL